MKKRNIIFLSRIIILLIGISLLMIGCTPAKRTAPLNYNQPSSKTTAPVSPAPAVAPPTATPVVTPSATTPIPKSLDNMESNAEDMIDDIANKNWSKASNKLAALKKEWEAYKPSAHSINIPQDQFNIADNDISNLTQSLQKKNQYDASIAANKVTFDVINFMKNYQSKIPPAVGELDYFGRQVLLTSQHGDWDQAKTAGTSAKAVWDSISQSASAISAAHAKDFNDTVSKMIESVDKKDKASAKKYSERLLDYVDVLETDFSKTK